jgi:hypothetical protein
MTLKHKISWDNRFFYLLISNTIYLFIYVLLSLKIKGIYQPFLGIFLITSSILLDYYLSLKKIRIYLRILLVLLFYLAVKLLVGLFSALVAPVENYHIIIDKIPFLFQRDSIIALAFIIFYFIFDAVKISRPGKTNYWLSSAIIFISFIFCFQMNVPINKTIFLNYFNLTVCLFLSVFLLLVRHILFHQMSVDRQFKKRDFILLTPLLLLIFLFIFSIILPENIKGKASKNSGLFNQGLFQFDFSDFLELKDEIELSDERVLILELQGLDEDVKKQINKGWNRQVYLKRYALEQYLRNGRFKVTSEFADRNSPPAYISGYQWKLKNVPDYQERIPIKEILYLLNIDSSSLMGSDLLYQVIPMINWEGSPYKQIYQSLSLINDSAYQDLMDRRMTQEQFLSQLHPRRKELLLDWGEGPEEQPIQELAQYVTDQYHDPFIKTLAIQEYLKKYYYYSLKPGISKSGNPLNDFLFEHQKGYCTYFAFSMTIMLRSLGIASRIAVGFAPDMENRTLNFYDVRSLHAHAWVEVFF